MPGASKKLGVELAVAIGTEQQIVTAFAMLATRHDREADIRDEGTMLATWSERHIAALKPFQAKYGKTVSERPERIRSALFVGTRMGSIGVLMDLKDMAAL